jgi:hypothetical protein
MSSKLGFFFQKKYNKIILIISFIFIFLNLIKKFGNNEQKFKICLCTLGKNENRYIREFAQYYKNYNVDKIFLYDNNDINGERFDIVLNDFLQDKFIKIINWRGKIKEQMKIMNHCYKENFDKYDWLIFYDIDEFIHLENYTDIKQFLNQRKFMNCQKIYLNWILHTDNDLINYDNRSLFKRFPIKDPNINKKKYYIPGKSILKGHIKNIIIQNMHILNKGLKGCNGFGLESIITNSNLIKNPDFRYYYIDHFYCKSLDEFTNKINRGSACSYHYLKFALFRIKRYFSLNKINIHKIKYIENKTGIDLSKFYKIVKK